MIDICSPFGSKHYAETPKGVMSKSYLLTLGFSHYAETPKGVMSYSRCALATGYRNQIKPSPEGTACFAG